MLKKIAYLVYLITFFSCTLLYAEPNNQNLATKSINKVNWKLLESASKKSKDGNSIISTYSINSALGMTYLGADNETKQAMSEALSFPDQENLARSFESLNSDLDGEYADDGVQIKVANTLYLDNDFPFRAEFLSSNRSLFKAAIENRSFLTQFEEVRLEINDNVYRLTTLTEDSLRVIATEDLNDIYYATYREEDKVTTEKIDAKVEEYKKIYTGIKDLLPPNSLRSDTKMVLVNSLMFLGRWVVKFGDYSQRDFNLSSSEKMNVSMMEKEEDLAAYRSQALGAQIVKIPYRANHTDKKLNFVLILPDKNTSLDTLVTNLNKQEEAFLDDSRFNYKCKTSIAMPKFSYKFKIELSSILSKPDYGMGIAFDANKADFSKMIDNASADTRSLYISKVFHQAKIDFDRNGTFAAAATAVVMTEAISIPQPPCRTIVADRPFAFAIEHQKTGTILFSGLVKKPDAL